MYVCTQLGAKTCYWIVSVRKDGEITRSMRGAVFSLCVSTCLSSGGPPRNQTWNSTRGQSASRQILRGTTEGCKTSGGGVLMAAHLQVFVGAFANSILSLVVQIFVWLLLLSLISSPFSSVVLSLLGCCRISQAFWLWWFVVAAVVVPESFSGCIHCCLHFLWCIQVSNFEEKKRDLENLRSEEVGSVAKMGWFWALVLRANALAGCAFARFIRVFERSLFFFWVSLFGSLVVDNMECTKSEDNIWLLNSLVFFLVDVLFSGHSWCYCTPCEFPKAMLTDASFLWNLLPAFVLVFERWCWWVELGRDSHFQLAEKLSNVGSVDLRSRLLR